MMSSLKIPDTGPEFEQRALSVARAIYDPSGLQGAVMFQGREHDGVFIDDRSIVALEFTTLRTKDKAIKDACKIRDILKHLGSQPQHGLKSLQGFFVTANEPLGDQRKAVEQISKVAGISIHCVSLVTLRKRLIDTENYLALRRRAPFGSTDFKLIASNPGKTNKTSDYIEPDLVSSAANSVSFTAVIDLISEGARAVVTGDFGAGKSEALRQVYERLRKVYFREPTDHRFPLHINLRDCYGLRSPREVLRRHAEDIGFPGQDSLIAAWRSGICTVILDGFDELVPSRWVGGARDLKQVRWQALEPVRRLVEETPNECGIIIAGRSQYFSSATELLQCLGLKGGEVYELQDFDDERARRLIDSGSPLPEWLPSRPLLLKFLAGNGFLNELGENSEEAGEAWWRMLSVISNREAERVSSVTPENVGKLIARIATLARSGSSGQGQVTVEDMRSVFRVICGYEAEAEGLQLLLRLPGLVSSGGTMGDAEVRHFVDSAFAEASYGLDLSSYISAPYVSHPLSAGVSWSSSAALLASNVAAVDLEKLKFDGSVVSGAVAKRLGDGHFDAVLLDVTLTANALGARVSAGLDPFLDGVLIPTLQLSGDQGYLTRSTFKDCVIELLDVSDVDADSEIPTFDSCIFGKVEGWSHVPPRLAGSFQNCEFDQFSAVTQTTSGLAQLTISQEDRVGLVILRKVYAQAGSARRVSALPRGLPLADRSIVPSVMAKLVSVGYLTKSTARTEDLVQPVKNQRATVAKVLAAPKTFSLSDLR